MERCVQCHRLIWPWQKAYPNGVWHQRCYDVWENGYNTAMKFCDGENLAKGYMKASDIYCERAIDNSTERRDND